MTNNAFQNPFWQPFRVTFSRGLFVPSLSFLGVCRPYLQYLLRSFGAAPEQKPAEEFFSSMHLGQNCVIQTTWENHQDNTGSMLKHFNKLTSSVFRQQGKQKHLRLFTTCRNPPAALVPRWAGGEGGGAFILGSKRSKILFFLMGCFFF